MEDFIMWLKTCLKSNGEPYKEKSVEHYNSGVKAISKQMLQEGVIQEPLEDMDLNKLDIAIATIFKTDSFIKKNNTGNSMYSNALKRFRCFKFINTEQFEKEFFLETYINKNQTITSTEKESLIKARRGQGVFRKKIIQRYNNQCVITQLSISQSLVASHIKPWVVCTNEERLNENNGLLLSATYDRLFDSGLISFKNDGKILISNLINDKNRNILNLKENRIYNICINSEMKIFLEYHRDHIFVS